MTQGSPCCPRCWGGAEKGRDLGVGKWQVAQGMRPGEEAGREGEWTGLHWAGELEGAGRGRGEEAGGGPLELAGGEKAGQSEEMKKLGRAG